MVIRSCVKWTAVAAVAAPILLAFGAFASNQAAAEVNFSDKRIVWIVPSREGGGSDNFTRALAPFFQQYLPGNPKIVVRNIPGTGGIPGQNTFWDQGGDDGLTLITTSTSQIMNQMLGTKAVRYDVTKYKTVLATPQGTFIYAHPSTGAKTADDIKILAESGKAYKFGGHGPTSTELRLMVSWHLLGVKIKPLWGMSRGKSRQAFMRGEVEVNFDGAGSYLKKVKPLAKKAEAVPLFSFGIQNDDDSFTRDPTDPEVPHFNEVYEKLHGKKLAGSARDAWEALFNIGVMTSKSIALPANVSDEIYKAYVDAAKAVFKDPKFKKVKKKRIGAYEVLFGTAAQKRIEKSANPDKQTRAWIKAYLKKHHDVDVNI
jgi:tripartite-type tricarboxylate transporter receptor subunit TctC